MGRGFQMGEGGISIKPHANMHTEGDEEMPDKLNARKRPTLDVTEAAAAPGDGSTSTVTELVNQLEQGKMGRRQR